MPCKKNMLYHCQNPGKPRVVLVAPTGISAVNIGGTTINSGLAIKPGTKLLVLNDKSKAALRNRLSEVKLLIIDELFMVFSDLWIDVDSVAGISVMTCSSYLQSNGSLYFLIFFLIIMKYLLGLQLRHLFKYAEIV